MRKSKYNYHFTDGNKIIMYNARTNALVRMDESDFKNYENYALNNQNEIEEELKQSLKYGGYIVEDDANELDMIRYQVYASRFSSNIMNLTIAPISDCNFRCPYCYERNVFTPEEFNKIEKEKQEDIKQLYPETIGAHCVCDSLNGFVIDSDGSLYKCWEEMGNKELCIGNIHDLDTNGKPAFYYDYLLFDPSKNEKCAQCEILPVCMGGGCPNRILRDEYQPNCKDIISRTHKNIKAYYHLMNEQRKEEC